MLSFWSDPGQPALNYCYGASSDLNASSLATLPVNQTSVNPELLNATFLREALTVAAQNVTTLVPTTIAGLISNDQSWKNWTEQNLANPPPWLSSSAQKYINDELIILVTNSATGLTILDYLTFNGITGIQTYFGTKSTALGICATFPGQLAQLYLLSFNSNLPSNQRAEYLGQLLAITSVMAALQGASEFGDQVQTALGRVGLSDAWPSIKPHL